MTESALGRDGCDRLHHRGSLDKEWPRHFLSALRHGTEDSPSSLRRLHNQSARGMGEANMARELTNHEDGLLNGKRSLIMDRDTKFSKSFRRLLSDEGIKPVRLPPRALNMNAHLERFFGSLKSECLHRLILFGEKATRNAIRQYLDHYHLGRPHQGLGNELIVPMEHPPDMNAKIETTETLGGLLRSYRRAA